MEQVTRIGNGLFARTRKTESLMDWRRRLQATCSHDKRDPRGMCYHCGDKAVAK